MAKRASSVLRPLSALLPLARARSSLAAAVLAAAAAPTAAALPQASASGHAPGAQPVEARPRLSVELASPVLDPKLSGAALGIMVAVPGPLAAPVTVTVEGPSGVVATPYAGVVAPGAPAQVAWNGRDASGAWLDVGAYVVRAAAPGLAPAQAPLHLVRLGVTEIEARDSAAGGDEWQMVYFKKGATYGFYATPDVHEYLCVAGAGEVSDLDIDGGDPRAPVPVHAATDSPALEGALYEDDAYNYPLCYLAGSTPRLHATFGASATSASGAATGVGYPVPGLDLRAVARVVGSGVADATGPIQPGVELEVDLAPLPSESGRADLVVEWRFQSRATGAPAGAPWTDVPGALSLPHRVYTLVGPPVFAPGASGTQVAGPWVEVAELWAQWKAAVGASGATTDGCVENHVKGFFGQSSGLPKAIEGVIYDAGPLGGDGGSTHYFSFGAWSMDLSALLDAHAKGVYVNCSDCMGASTTMLAMMGVRGVRPIRLGPMQLKAIWGIGAPAYTTSLWGFSHGFSYHHVVTRDDGASVIDTCMQLDEDGDPGSVPGVPGWNVDRPWDGPAGYNALSAYNDVSKSLESLPAVH